MAARGIWKNPVLTLNAVSYTGEVNEATLTPETSIQTQKTLNPAVILQDVDTPTWTFTLNGFQGGLTDCLTDMEPGTEVDVVMQAGPGAGHRTATFTVLAVPADFGGAQGVHAPFSLSLPVVDQPVFDTSS